jgi:hypothetical protein
MGGGYRGSLERRHARCGWHGRAPVLESWGRRTRRKVRRRWRRRRRKERKWKWVWRHWTTV